MKLTATQQLLKKHSNRIWARFKRMQGVYVNEDDISYKLAVHEHNLIPDYPDDSDAPEPMIVITLHELINDKAVRVIPVLSSRKAMDSVYELDQVEQAYQDILHYTGASPTHKFYDLLEEVIAIFKITEEDEDAGL